MLKILFKSTIPVFFFICNSFAQLPKASEFLPLKVGNIWQHQRADSFGAVVQSEVISDTLLGDTLIVYKTLAKAFQDPPSEGFHYFYYSLDSTIVYRQYITFPDPPYNLASLPLLDTSGGLGGTWEVFLGDITAIVAITDTGTASFFGEQRRWLDVYAIEERGDSIEIDPGYHFRFVEGIGITREGTDTLIYAKINGKEYGTPATSVGEVPRSNPLPDDFNLQVYPNPASVQVTFFLENVPEGAIEITIHDILGRKVRSFELVSTNSIRMQINWDGRDTNNQSVASGVYFVTMSAGRLTKTSKFVYLP